MNAVQETNVPLREGFGQVCVWPGAVPEEGASPEVFEEALQDLLDIPEVQFLEVIETPDGRRDVFFALREADVPATGISRLEADISLLEELLSPPDYASPDYPPRVKGYVSYDPAMP